MKKGPNVITEAIAADLGARLQEGREVVYVALSGQEGIAFCRADVAAEDVVTGAVSARE